MRTSDKQKYIGRNIRRRKAVPTVDYKEHLLEELKDSRYAQPGYLTAAIQGKGEDVFLLAARVWHRHMEG